MYSAGSLLIGQHMHKHCILISQDSGQLPEYTS